MEIYRDAVFWIPVLIMSAVGESRQAQADLQDWDAGYL